MTRKYNFIIFGATGESGKGMIAEIARILAEDGATTRPQFTWAVAGRSMPKLIDALREVSNDCGQDLTRVDKILADSTVPNSLNEMAAQTEVLLNLVGPYLLHGEAVVKACVEEGTHHLDLSAEDQFLEEMQLKYHKAAETSGSLIIGATGIASIPSDYGAVYLEKNFRGELNSVESYFDVLQGWKVPKSHYGTWNSVLLMMHRHSELEALKGQLFPFPYFKFEHNLSRMPLRYSKEVNAWVVPLPFPNARVMERTQRAKFYDEDRRPAQTNFYLQTQSFFLAFLVTCASWVLAPFLRFRIVLWTFQAASSLRWLYQSIASRIRSIYNPSADLPFALNRKFPRIFSFGSSAVQTLISKETDSPFTFTLIGKGWGKGCGQTSGPKSIPPNKIVILKISGQKAYGDTATIMLQAGLTILEDRLQMPCSGGVYTPGTAFARTGLVERLNRNGITFNLDILPDPDYEKFRVKLSCVNYSTLCKILPKNSIVTVLVDSPGKTRFVLLGMKTK